ncbi:MAG: hypothetical protein ACW98K_00395 [Candidatus Kariarchaeaceae archaeon]|jgi:hypothetical protein
MAPETTLSPQKLTSTNFPELPIFILSSLLFLDAGIFLGALNTFNYYERLDFLGWDIPDEIHQTHWTSTLLGGVTFMMLGQMYFFFSQVNGKPHKYHKYTLAVWGIWLLGLIFSYLSVWDDYNTYIDYVILSFRIGSLAFTILLFAFFLDREFIEKFKNHYVLIFFPAAAFWLLIAVLLNFDISQGATLNRMFLFTYIYGFFSLALFGSLLFVLPILFKQKPVSKVTVRRYFVLFNLAAIIILGDLYMIEERGNETYRGDWVMDFLGPGVWGLAGFLFILWVFDLIYKAGTSPSLVALQIALMMFGFFVLDTLMKNIFEAWVDRSHFHFLFIGTLLITIIAIGTRIIVMQYVPENGMIADIDRITFSGSSGIRTGGILLTIAAVCGVLTGFTIEDYKVAGWSGVILFFGLIIVQFSLVFHLKAARKDALG